MESFVICCVAKEVMKMAEITIEKIYCGEPYNVLNKAKGEYLTNGCPYGFEEQCWIEMLLVKYAIIAAEKIKAKGDSISGMTDKELSLFFKW